MILHGGSLCVQDHFVREVLACEVPFQREQPACSQSFFCELNISTQLEDILGEHIEFAGKHPWPMTQTYESFSPDWLRHGKTLLAAFQTEDIRPAFC